jgi:hypothetical protein
MENPELKDYAEWELEAPISCENPNTKVSILRKDKGQRIVMK